MSILDELEAKPENKCYEPRIDYLRREKGWDTTLIEKGVDAAADQLLNGAKSFVIYGEPQSGKTEVMIALTCRLIDEGYETVFILMNDNTELETQNYYRFCACTQLNPSPTSLADILYTEEQQLKSGTQRIIFCRKNSANLKKLLERCRFMEKRVVIDDEADYASPNSNINKEDKEATKINALVDALISGDQGGVYVGVTATPARLDLNNTFKNKAKNWVFLDTHESYKGRDYFFPLSDEQILASDYHLIKLPEDGDNPKWLEDAILRFLVRTAYMNIESGKKEHIHFSMLVHTDGKINVHLEDKKFIEKTLFHLSGERTKKKERLFETMYEYAKAFHASGEFTSDATEAVRFVQKNIGKKSVLAINSKHDRQNVERACNPSALFTFGIGGNIVSRGLTFNNLLSFFFSRSVKGKLQQNTYIQRARMFGDRPYAKHFELCVPEYLYNDWALCFHDHELSIQLAISGDYIHVQSAKNSAADSASIDKTHVYTSKGETETGDVFPLTNHIETILKDTSVHGFIRLESVEEYLDQNNFDVHGITSGLFNFIKSVSSDNGADFGLVLLQNGEIRDISTLNDPDLDYENIRRPRGGLIQATIHKVVEYEKLQHLIMPVTNGRGQVRYLYKGFNKKSLMQNFLDKR